MSKFDNIVFLTYSEFQKQLVHWKMSFDESLLFIFQDEHIYFVSWMFHCFAIFFLNHIQEAPNYLVDEFILQY